MVNVSSAPTTVLYVRIKPQLASSAKTISTSFKGTASSAVLLLDSLKISVQENAILVQSPAVSVVSLSLSADSV
jgi:hypothetical protein